MITTKITLGRTSNHFGRITDDALFTFEILRVNTVLVYGEHC